MLVSLFQACEASTLGTAIRESTWAFPVIESVHLVALAMLGGAVLLVDLRLLGLTLRDQPVARLARDVQPWLNASLVLMVLSGAPLFASEAMEYYYSEFFRLKMMTLSIATVFTFTIRKAVVFSDAPPARARIKLTALTSLGLWLSVGAAGRWIGFSG